ncbi:MAG: tRNA (guanosine(37)-N1)-methyltransferase TrmD [Bacteroidota bacterium]
MRIDIITGLPGIVTGPLDQSILHRAAKKGLVDIRVHDLRDFAVGKHRQIDDYPYGGGAGMVFRPEPLFDCIEAIQAEVGADAIDEVIFLTPDGQVFDQPMANALSMHRHVVLIAGHYKGIDQRVRDVLVTKEVSIGDFVLSGGELPALILVDALVRLIPGVLNDAQSALTDSFQDHRLDAPCYTRPASYRGMDVPAVLLSGNHAKVQQWRDEQRQQKTQQRRPDLLER